MCKWLLDFWKSLLKVACECEGCFGFQGGCSSATFGGADTRFCIAGTDIVSTPSPSRPPSRTMCRPDFSVGEAPLKPKRFGEFTVKWTKEEFEIKKQLLPFQFACFYNLSTCRFVSGAC